LFEYATVPTFYLTIDYYTVIRQPNHDCTRRGQPFYVPFSCDNRPRHFIVL